jgi:hypothetical protein
MCIYCGTDKYRKIYENHYGPIPKDEEGRSYEIHHIDGNHSNNSPTNLKCVTIKEHYDIHYSQGDYGACWLIAKKMRLSPTEISTLAKLSNQQRVANGTHNLLDKEAAKERAIKLVESGRHHFLDGSIQTKSNKRRIEAGTHNFLDRKAAKERAIKLVESGRHNLLGGRVQQKQLQQGKHPSQIKKTCSYCGIICSSNMFSRYHGDKCKLNV